MAGGIAWVAGGGALADDGKPYYCTHNEWSMIRARVGGVWKYGLFRKVKFIGIFLTGEDVSNKVRELEAK